MSRKLLLLTLALAACAPTYTAVIAKRVSCGDGSPMRVHFYDVGQALAVLVELPTGELVLFDAGESATRAGCGQPCRDWNERFLAQLHKDVAGREVALLWVSHPHSDHIGGVASVLEREGVKVFADNGLGRDSATVKKALEAAASHNVKVELATATLPASVLTLGDGVSVVGVLPPNFDNCKNLNNCSVGLRIDYCQSSVLLVGDAEEEEDQLDPLGEVTVLQVGHHGSETSSSAAFLAKVKPKWAVVSSARRDEGTNRTYCHPRAGAVERLTTAMGDATGSVSAFDGKSCSKGTDEQWKATAASSRLLFTARDGKVTLSTTGDGTFTK